MSKAPAFQFYANDFMDATRLWEANAVGLFIRCLCIQWTQGSIPADMKLIARATHCDLSDVQQAWKTVGEKFAPGEDGLLRNKRLEEIRERQNEISSLRSKAGKAGANAKANASDLPQAKAQQRKVKEKEKVEVEREVEGTTNASDVHEAILWPSFDDWWELYDKRIGRSQCLQKWSKLSQADREEIMRHSERYVPSQPNKQYQKHPATYLNQKAWLDEVIETTPNANGKRTSVDPEQVHRNVDAAVDRLIRDGHFDGGVGK